MLSTVVTPMFLEMLFLCHSLSRVTFQMVLFGHLFHDIPYRSQTLNWALRSLRFWMQGLCIHNGVLGWRQEKTSDADWVITKTECIGRTE